MNSNSINKGVYFFSADSQNEDREWLVKKTDSGQEAIRTRFISLGMIESISYSLLLKITINKAGFFPLLIIRCRAKKPEILSTSIMFQVKEGDFVNSLPLSQAQPVYSIIHKDFVCSFAEPIEEDDLVHIFNGKSKLSIVYGDITYEFTDIENASLSYCHLKEKLAPKTLNEEQRDILHQEVLRNEEIARHKERLREQERIEWEKQKRFEQEEQERLEADMRAEYERFSIQKEKERLEKEKTEQERREREQKEKLEEQQRQLQKEKEHEIRVISDAKVLVNHIVTERRRLRLDTNLYTRPGAWEKYLPQFMDYKYLQEVEDLLKNRDILFTDKLTYNTKINKPLLDRCSLNQLYDIIDKKTTADEVINSNNNSPQKSGCYIATCVYGSYDCPEVWTLRRYRDQVLTETWAGRLFIKTYYAVSPKLVQWFGDTSWFRMIWRKRLDKLIKRLRKSGMEDTPYTDKY